MHSKKAKIIGIVLSVVIAAVVLILVLGMGGKATFEIKDNTLTIGGGQNQTITNFDKATVLIFDTEYITDTKRLFGYGAGSVGKGTFSLKYNGNLYASCYVNMDFDIERTIKIITEDQTYFVNTESVEATEALFKEMAKVATSYLP